MKRFFVIFLMIAAYTAPCTARGGDTIPHIGARISFSPAKIIAADKAEKKWIKGKKSYSVAAELLYSPLPKDSDMFAEDYNYPTFAVSLKYNFNHGITMHRSPDPLWGYAKEADYDSYMGNILTLYGSFSRPFFRTRRWEADYTFGMGFGYTRTKYNPHNNVDNELIGSRWLIYFTGGLFATWHFARDFGLRGGITFYHHSNGALNRPNKGSNILGPSLGIVYEPYYETLEKRAKLPKKDFEKYFYLNFTCGVGAKTLNEDWMRRQFWTPKGESRYRTGRFRMYAAYSLQADLMYRYARRWASGVGFDVFRGTYADHVARWDKHERFNLKHDNWSYGIALKHQAFYHNISMAMEFGYYLHREMGRDDNEIRENFPFYERIGLHYAFPRLAGFELGVNVKAHLFKADFTELSFGIPVILAKSRPSQK